MSPGRSASQAKPAAEREDEDEEDEDADHVASSLGLHRAGNGLVDEFLDLHAAP